MHVRARFTPRTMQLQSHISSTPETFLALYLSPRKGFWTFAIPSDHLFAEQVVGITWAGFWHLAVGLPSLGISHASPSALRSQPCARLPLSQVTEVNSRSLNKWRITRLRSHHIVPWLDSSMILWWSWGHHW